MMYRPYIYMDVMNNIVFPIFLGDGACKPRNSYSAVVLEDMVLVSRRLEDLKKGLGLGLGLDKIVLVLVLVLKKRSC
jgi:hypothetical protein